MTTPTTPSVQDLQDQINELKKAVLTLDTNLQKIYSAFNSLVKSR
jgi:hypothetical protein